MKAVFSAVQLQHAPSRFLSRGHIVDYPESPERARILLKGARQAGARIHASRSFAAAHVEAIHTRRYLKFLAEAFRKWVRPKGAFPEVMPSLRPVEHPARYPRHITGRAGWHMMDFSCPITETTWQAVCASADTALTAADLVAGGQPAAYALCRPPGHHAYGDRAGGFCYLNNTALAAEYLRHAHERVAILDIDVHHGNGTQAIFYARSDILTVSVHADPARFYPFYYGYESQRGRGPGNGFNLNIPVPVRSDDEVWLGAVHYAAEAIAQYAPGALVIALGLDAHESDPLKGGAMTTDGFARLARVIAGLSLPTVIVQEGGYQSAVLADNLAGFLGTYEAGA
jgi:acetoin utilization deacetylase AcuC-like enzyme